MKYVRESERARIFVRYCQEVIYDQDGGMERSAKGRA